MYVEEGADILFLDSPADEAEVRRAVAAAQGRPSFAVLSPGAPRETPTQVRAAELGLKIGTHPTALISPVAAAIMGRVGSIEGRRGRILRLAQPGGFPHRARLRGLQRGSEAVHPGVTDRWLGHRAALV